MPTTIFLFDIDQTLLRADGLARRTMERVFEELHGLPRAFAQVDFAGRADGAILRDCYQLHGPAGCDVAGEIARFRGLYVPYLEADLAAAGGCTVLPGVTALLDALALAPNVRLGLGTGNYRATAELKLRAGGLWDRFLDGGFADDSDERPALIAAGLRRLTAGVAGCVDAWVIGDSPHDVSAAKANGLRCVGVGTGRCSPEHLLALGAEVAFADLSDTAAFLAATLGH